LERKNREKNGQIEKRKNKMKRKLIEEKNHIIGEKTFSLFSLFN